MLFTTPVTSKAFTTRGRQAALLLSLLMCAWCAQAQTRYVIDELRINLRSGQGDQYRIVEILPSGTRMNILNQGDTDEWVEVQTAAGQRGWVRAQYLQSGPIYRDQFNRAQQQLSALETQSEELTEQNQQLKEENIQLKTRLESTTSQSSNLSQELEQIKKVSANAMNLNAANQKLMEEQQILKTEIDVLKAENERLISDSRQTWFMYGGIAVVTGMLMTLIIQRIRSRRRNSEWA